MNDFKITENICNKCNTENEEEAVSCIFCGEKLLSKESNKSQEQSVIWFIFQIIGIVSAGCLFSIPLTASLNSTSTLSVFPVVITFVILGFKRKENKTLSIISLVILFLILSVYLYNLVH